MPEGLKVVNGGGDGVWGVSTNDTGVSGSSFKGPDVTGVSDNGTGVSGTGGRDGIGGSGPGVHGIGKDMG